MRPRTLTPIKLTQGGLRKQYDGFVRSLRGRAPETRGTYERALREFLRWYKVDRKCRFVKDDIVRYKNHLVQEKQLSQVSVSTYLTAVRQFCDFLTQRGILRENPARTVGGSGRPTAHSRQTLSAEEVRAVLDAVHPGDELGLRDLAFIKLMVLCGLSEIEIIRANSEDLVLRDGESTLRVQGKGRLTKDAVVQIPPNVRIVLEQYLSVRGSPSPRDPLFASAGNRTRGERMTTRGVRERVNHYLEVAGVKKGRLRQVTPYSLRHTAAVLMAEAGATADEIRDRMRLGSVMTALLYLNKVKDGEEGKGVAKKDRAAENTTP
ncbi:MAG TPA: tyrosine-type recombinase/integrase [Bacteroidota bacterium]|nr:tyrosine-type recombinase/integrase [Bacteroidota bacterium]